MLLKNHLKHSYLQKACINSIENIFDINLIVNMIDESYSFLGLRGKFEDKENYCVCFNFDYYEYNFKFYLCYDQLEYTILKKKNKVRDCSLEDFWEDDILVEKFISCLKKDLKKLEIPDNSDISN